MSLPFDCNDDNVEKQRRLPHCGVGDFCYVTEVSDNYYNVTGDNCYPCYGGTGYSFSPPPKVLLEDRINLTRALEKTEQFQLNVNEFERRVEILKENLVKVKSEIDFLSVEQESLQVAIDECDDDDEERQHSISSQKIEKHNQLITLINVEDSLLNELEVTRRMLSSLNIDQQTFVLAMNAKIDEIYQLHIQRQDYEYNCRIERERTISYNENITRKREMLACHQAVEKYCFEKEAAAKATQKSKLRSETIAKLRQFHKKTLHRISYAKSMAAATEEARQARQMTNLKTLKRELDHQKEVLITANQFRKERAMKQEKELMKRREQILAAGGNPFALERLEEKERLQRLNQQKRHAVEYQTLQQLQIEFFQEKNLEINRQRIRAGLDKIWTEKVKQKQRLARRHDRKFYEAYEKGNGFDESEDNLFNFDFMVAENLKHTSSSLQKRERSKLDKEVAEGEPWEDQGSNLKKDASAAFKVTPENIIFKDFDLGKTYRKKVTVSNRTNQRLRFYFRELTDLFQKNETETQDDEGKNVEAIKEFSPKQFQKSPITDVMKVLFDAPPPIFPGLSHEFFLVFSPKTLDDWEGELNFDSAVGSFMIPVKCFQKRFAPSLSTGIVTFPNVIGGTIASAEVKLKNYGSLPGTITQPAVNTKNRGFSVSLAPVPVVQMKEFSKISPPMQSCRIVNENEESLNYRSLSGLLHGNIYNGTSDRPQWEYRTFDNSVGGLGLCRSRTTLHVEEATGVVAATEGETPLKEIAETPLKEMAETPFKEMAETPSKEIAKTLAKEIPETRLKEIVENPLKEIAETPLQEIAETDLKEIVENPLKEIAETPLQEIAETDLKEIVENPLKEIAETPLQEIAETDVTDIVENPLKETAETPLQETAETDLKDIVENPLKETAETPLQEIAETDLKDIVEIPLKETAEIPLKEIAETDLEDIAETGLRDIAEADVPLAVDEPFTVNIKQSTNRLAANEELTLMVNYKPDVVGEHELTYEIKFDDPDITPLKLHLEGNSIENPFKADPLNTNMKICLINMNYQQPIEIRNMSKGSGKIIPKVPSILKPFVDVTPKSVRSFPGSPTLFTVRFSPRLEILQERKIAQFFDSESKILDFPVSFVFDGFPFEIPGPLICTFQAILDNPELEVTPTAIDFGICSTTETVRAKVTIRSIAAAPQHFGFVEMPDWIAVQPNYGFGTLLSGESREMYILVSPPPTMVGKHQLTLKLRTLSKEYAITVKVIGKIPTTTLSYSQISFPVTCIGSSTSALTEVYIKGTQSKIRNFQGHRGHGGDGFAGPFESMTQFEFLIDKKFPIEITPSIGTIKPGKGQKVLVTFAPDLSYDEVKLHFGILLQEKFEENKQNIQIELTAIHALLPASNPVQKTQFSKSGGRISGKNKKLTKFNQKQDLNSPKRPTPPQQKKNKALIKSVQRSSRTTQGQVVIRNFDDIQLIFSDGKVISSTKQLRELESRKSFLTRALEATLNPSELSNANDLDFKKTRRHLMQNFPTGSSTYTVPCRLTLPDKKEELLLLTLKCPMQKPDLILLDESSVVNFGLTPLTMSVIKELNFYNASIGVVDLKMETLNSFGPFARVNALRRLAPNLVFTLRLKFTPLKKENEEEMVTVFGGESKIGITLKGEGTSEYTKKYKQSK